MDFDDVSSESSVESSEDSEALEQYMQECYYHAYQQFEAAARDKNH